MRFLEGYRDFESVSTYSVTTVPVVESIVIVLV